MNPATQASLFAGALVLSIKAIYELVLLVKKQVNAKSANTGVYCNYPLQGGGCAFASHDFNKLRTVELVQGVTAQLSPALEKQNTLLQEIRDGVRDLNHAA